MRRILLVAGALAVAACVGSLSFGADKPIPEARTVVLSAHAIPLYGRQPNERRAGKLIYRGGLEISSEDGRFGGLSDLAVSADGTRMLAVIDDSRWFRAHLSYDKQGNLAGIGDAEVAPMLDLAGIAMRGKEGDAEGLAAEADGDVDGAVLVSFERDHRVWRYDLSKGLDAKPTLLPVGSWIDGLMSNQGLEAIALLPQDRLLLLSEDTPDDQHDIMGSLEAYPPMVAHGGFGQLGVRKHDPFAVTSAAPDGDGGVFILERRFSPLGGLGMEIRHVAAAEIKPGARLQGEVIATLSGASSNIDNMEGIAMRKGADGRTYLYVVADDNFNALQRTMLMLFEVAQ